MTFDNRITRMLGIDIPIANAPMGGVVTQHLVGAMAEAGAIGVLPNAMTRGRDNIRAVRELTDRPLGANIHVGAAEKTPFDVFVEEGIRFVTTCIGPVPKNVAQMQASGLKVFHVVTSLDEAQRAADAGVDGLVVEGFEAAALRGDTEVPLMVLLPLVTGRVDLPVIAAGGISDGVAMAAAFALGAEGVSMGTRMIASVEAAVHDNYKQAVVTGTEVDTIVVNRHEEAPLRVLRTPTTTKFLDPAMGNAFTELVPSIFELYRDGDMEASFACVGMVAGRIEEVEPVAEIIGRTVEEFGAAIARLALDHGVDTTKLR
ncbi:MAG TPA: nitronate monooxygenase [Acidimicrobiia bacterium]|nr:nitronate monooxygenase [Acidimicrobiia bacterium]